ncbi:MAG: SulP family inorganic anion transporter [Actinobacteria bacterium]|nr:SulP family inorganic anion transporter [Actinomycetota bacterium]
MARDTHKRPGLIKRYLPITAWLPAYEKKWLAGDIVAALTVWALLVPEALAYAGIAGVPVQYGLYAAPFALLAYAVFGSSRHMVFGPSAEGAAVSAAAVAPLVAGGDSDRYLALTITLALMVGVIMIVLGLVRMGFIAKFFAAPVLDGFIVGAAIFIAVGQLGKVFGIAAEGDNTFSKFADVFRQAGSWSWTTIAVGGGCLLLLFLLHRLVPKLPAALTIMVLAIILSSALKFTDHGISIVGEVPSGLPGWSLSGVGLSDIWSLVPGALGLVVLCFAESLATAKVYATKYGYRLDPNLEMMSYGMANVGAGLFQGFAVTGSVSKTAANDAAGGKTELAMVFCSILTLLTILFLAGLFKYLPEATLAAVVIHAVARLIRFKELRRLYRVRKTDFALAFSAFLGVLIFGLLEGILIGVLLSLVLFIQRASSPHWVVLGVDESGTRYGALKEHPDYRPIDPALIVFRFDAPLIFSNADEFSDTIMRLVDEADPQPRAVIVDGEDIFDIDTTAADKLIELSGGLAKKGIVLLLARVHVPTLETMRREGVVDAVGEENVFPTVDDAVRAYRERSS